MALVGKTCWQCLARLRLSTGTPVANPSPLSCTRTAPFSTTPTAQFGPKNKKTALTGRQGPPKRGERALVLKKKKRDPGRPPAPGERRAIQNRIVLSNTNALDVPDVPNLSAENLNAQIMTGGMVGLPGDVVDALRANESFKSTQRWRYFRRPVMLAREETAELASFMDALESVKDKKTMRKIVLGPRGSGKSVFLLQAHTMAFLRGWIVIHIPEAQDLTIAHTAYSPLPNTDPVKYGQATYTSKLLAQIVKANGTVLDKLRTTLDHSSLPVPPQPDATLSHLAKLGAGDPEIAWPVFKALWAELTAEPSDSAQKRPPMLFTVDGIAHISRLSDYLAPNMYNIHAHDLALVDHFLTYFGGSHPASIPTGGILLAADSNSNRPAAPALDLAIRQTEELQTANTLAALPSSDAAGGSSQLPLYDPTNPTATFDVRVLASMQNVPVLRLKGCSLDQTRALLEYYARSGMLTQAVYHELVSEAWLASGKGVVGEIERAAVVEGALGITPPVNERRTKLRMF